MSADKFAQNIEKLAAKVEGLKRKFNSNELENDFNNLRDSVLESFEEMVDIVHQDDEAEPEEEKEDE